jgi:hypothetical protein
MGKYIMARFSSIAASVCGDKHFRKQQPCEDGYVCYPLSSNSQLIMVCDGAGSAKKAVQGVAISLYEIVERAKAIKSWSQEAIYSLFDAAHTAILKEAQVQKVDIKEYSTTLLVAVIDAVNQKVYVAQVGDGTIVFKKDNVIKRLNQDQSAFLDQTDFISNRSWKKNVKYAELSNVSFLALQTDGVDPINTNLSTGLPFKPFYEHIFGWFESKDKENQASLTHKQAMLEQFLDSKALKAKTDDDKTLVLFEIGHK